MAGSLLQQQIQLHLLYLQLHPYQGEARGSVQIANMILDGLRRPDVFVSAGTIPIKKLMNASDPLADWLVKSGSAEMVITYTPNSRFFNDLEKARTGELPWYEVTIQARS